MKVTLDIPEKAYKQLLFISHLDSHYRGDISRVVASMADDYVTREGSRADDWEVAADDIISEMPPVMGYKTTIRFSTKDKTYAQRVIDELTNAFVMTPNCSSAGGFRPMGEPETDYVFEAYFAREQVTIETKRKS